MCIRDRPADGPCRVTAVKPDSPAAKAGLQAGDIIERLGERATPTVADFHLALIGRRPDQVVSLTVSRQGTPVAMALTLAQRPKPDGAALLKQKFGLTAAPLSPEKAKAMSMRVPAGLQITAVESDLFQMLARMPEPGDVLARVGRIRPRSLDHLGLLLEKLQPGQPVPLVILRMRDGTATRIDLNMPPRAN